MLEPTTFDWAAFGALVVLTVAFDALVFGRSRHRFSFREATIRSLLWVFVGVGFTAFVYARFGTQHAVTYLTAYLIEKSLSVDNLFVFLVIFSYFKVSDTAQQRILFWGVAGAVVMRAVFIVAGAAVLKNFHWMMYVFGLFLVYAGLKLLTKKDDTIDPESNFALRMARKYLRTTDEVVATSSS